MLNRKGQNIAEYSILIALVIAAAVAMNTYVKRGVQARVHDAVKYTGPAITDSGDGGTGNDFTFTGKQYEPYYANSTSTQTSTKSAQEVTSASGKLERKNIDDRSVVKADSAENVTAPDAVQPVN